MASYSPAYLKRRGNGEHGSSWPFPGWDKHDLRLVIGVTTRWRQSWPHFHVEAGQADDGSPWVAVTTVEGYTVIHIGKDNHSEKGAPYYAMYNGQTCHAKTLAGLLTWIAGNQPDIQKIVKCEGHEHQCRNDGTLLT